MNHSNPTPHRPSPELHKASSSPYELRKLLVAIASSPHEPATQVTWLCPRAEFERCSAVASREGFALYAPGDNRMPRLEQFVEMTNDAEHSLVACDDQLDAAVFLQTLACIFEARSDHQGTRAILVTGDLLVDELVSRAISELMPRAKSLGFVIILVPEIR